MQQVPGVGLELMSGCLTLIGRLRSYSLWFTCVRTRTCTHTHTHAHTCTLVSLWYILTHLLHCGIHTFCVYTCVYTCTFCFPMWPGSLPLPHPAGPQIRWGGALLWFIERRQLVWAASCPALLSPPWAVALGSWWLLAVALRTGRNIHHGPSTGCWLWWALGRPSLSQSGEVFSSRPPLPRPASRLNFCPLPGPPFAGLCPQRSQHPGVECSHSLSTRV